MEPKDIPVGVVGLGLMGCSITACLLMAGHPVMAIAPIPADMTHAHGRIAAHLQRSWQEGLTDKHPDVLLQSLLITEDFSSLRPCKLVIESTIENLDIKKTVYGKIEAIVDTNCLLVSNTSAIPISILQKLTQHPERFFGLHWAEPSHTTRFLEVICGDLSNIELGEYLYDLSHLCG